MAFYIDDKCLIKKTILHGGKGEIQEHPDGTKVTFHFRTQKQDEEETVLDDSRQLGKPMELIIGKKFKMEAWEQCLKTMRVDEVAQFSVDKSLVSVYPWVSSVVRKVLGSKPNHENHSPHCCGGMMAFQKDDPGFTPTNTLLTNPEPLTFIFELLKLEHPGEYTQESWTMNDKEKLVSITGLKDEGNKLYQQQKYSNAAEKYAEALGRLEQLILKEKPGDAEWNELDQMKIPLLLNYSQCQLLQKEFYSVIEHTTTVLEKDTKNVKALFRRAKAHVGAWNVEDARKDFQTVMELDPSLTNAVKKELHEINRLEQEKKEEDKNRLCGKIF